jgi:3-methyladenine DNA glycosylase Mpg
MTRKNKNGSFSPFGLYGEWFKLANQTTEILTSSAQVILLRSQMINQAMTGQIPWTDPEFMLLWQEKMSASLEATESLSKMMTEKALAPFDVTQGPSNFIEAMSVSTRPYHVKVRANARRLKRKKP